jgi:hypothetical protein
MSTARASARSRFFGVQFVPSHDVVKMLVPSLGSSEIKTLRAD